MVIVHMAPSGASWVCRRRRRNNCPRFAKTPSGAGGDFSGVVGRILGIREIEATGGGDTDFVTRISQTLAILLSTLVVAACDGAEPELSESAIELEVQIEAAVERGDIVPMLNLNDGQGSVPADGLLPTDLATLCEGEFPVGVAVTYEHECCECMPDGTMSCYPIGEQPEAELQETYASSVSIETLEAELSPAIEAGSLVPLAAFDGEASSPMPGMLPSETQLMCAEGIAVGATFEFDCNTCKCLASGEIVCTRQYCADEETLLEG